MRENIRGKDTGPMKYKRYRIWITDKQERDNFTKEERTRNEEKN